MGQQRGAFITERNSPEAANLLPSVERHQETLRNFIYFVDVTNLCCVSIGNYSLIENSSPIISLSVFFPSSNESKQTVRDADLIVAGLILESQDAVWQILALRLAAATAGAAFQTLRFNAARSTWLVSHRFVRFVSCFPRTTSSSCTLQDIQTPDHKPDSTSAVRNTR